MKATEQYFPIILFIMPHEVDLTRWVCGRIPRMTIQVKDIEKYFTMVHYIVHF